MNLADVVGPLLEWLWRASWQASVLVGLVLLVQAIFRNKLAARWRSALWWLVLIRLVMPVVPQTPWSLFNYMHLDRMRVASVPLVSRAIGPRVQEGLDAAFARPSAPGPAEPNKKVSTPTPEAGAAAPTVVVAAGAPERPGQPWAWRQTLAAFWLAGVLVFLGRVAWAYGAFARRLRHLPGIQDPTLLALFDECRQTMGARKPAALIATPEVDSPALFGCWRVRLLLPERLTTEFSREELRYVLLHELAHLRRGDVRLNWLITLLQALHWFNPVLWLGFARMRADRELACDALALAVAPDEAKRPYGRTILRLLEGFTHPSPVPGLVGIVEDRKQMENRLRMIARFKKSNRGSAPVALLLIGLVAVTLTDAQTDNGGARQPTALVGADTVVEPKTELKFTAARTIEGSNDQVSVADKLALSPNGRWFHWGGMVLPLDGAAPFRLVDLQVQDEACSPDGRWIAYINKGGLYVVPVDADDGKSAGPVRTLSDTPDIGEGRCLAWTRDSARVVLLDSQGGMRAVSVRDGVAGEWTDLASLGILSPDGRTLAYSAWGDGIWIQSAAGGVAQRLSSRGEFNRCEPVAWSADSQWIIGRASAEPDRHELRFIHAADGRQYAVAVPTEVGTFVGMAHTSRELCFYRRSYEVRNTPRIVSFGDRQPKSVSLDRPPDLPRLYQWSPDGATVTAITWNNKDDRGRCWLLPVSGAPVRELNVDLPELGGITPLRLDPSCRRLLFAATDKDGQEAYFVAPVSLELGKTIGPADRLGTHLFGGPTFWAPDGSRLAVRRAGQLWTVSPEGNEWSQPSPNIVYCDFVSWSPEGSQLGFVTYPQPGNLLYVVPAQGGEPRVVHTWPGNSFAWDWTPDGKSVTVAADGVLRNVPIAGGTGEALLRLPELGFSDVNWLGWSPDGQQLAFYAVGSAKERDELFVMGGQDRIPRKLTAQDHWPTREGFAWSPDSHSIAYTYQDRVKVGRAGILYTLDADEALKKAMAEALPPAPIAGLNSDALKRWETTALPGTTIAEQKPAASITAPPAEPILGPVFTDNFDHGASPHWRLLDTLEVTDPTLHQGHAVENGELVLAHASARLDGSDGIDWTDYLVKVRICIKAAVPGGQGLVGIHTRTTPSNFGILNADRYNLLIVCQDNTPRSLWLGRLYRDASNQGRRVTLGASTCSVVRDQWFTLELEVRGQQLRGYLDGKLVMEATDAALAKGGIWLSAYRARAHFDDFSVRQLPWTVALGKTASQP